MENKVTWNVQCVRLCTPYTSNVWLLRFPNLDSSQNHYSFASSTRVMLFIVEGTLCTLHNRYISRDGVVGLPALPTLVLRMDVAACSMCGVCPCDACLA
jgi:hypothetical protein